MAEFLSATHRIPWELRWERAGNAGNGTQVGGVTGSGISVGYGVECAGEGWGDGNSNAYGIVNEQLNQTSEIAPGEGWAYKADKCTDVEILRENP
jgi:hypothetical protein